jgi:hypothetical protein
MRNYLAVWSWTVPNGRRQEITMSFWAFDEPAARGIAHRWWDHAGERIAADFTLTDLSAERIP